jgi:hypothetical protein
MRWKIYFALPLFLFYSVKTNAQNNAYFPVKDFFFNEYHSWKSIPNPFLSDYEDGSLFTRESYTKDNKTYYKLYFNYNYYHNTGASGQTSYGFNQRYVGDLNYDTLQNKVYLNNELLYDFSLNEGDIYPLTTQYTTINSNIRVLNIDTIVDPYNIIRKIFYIGYINNSLICDFNGSSICAVIIEGIGNLNGMFSPLIDCFEDCTNTLSCASFNNKNYTFSNNITTGFCNINNNLNSNAAFPDSNYSYYEVKYHRLFDMAPFDELRYSIYYKKDTLINNNKYHLLYFKYKTFIPSGPPPNIQGDKPIALLRNDKVNKKVFIKRMGFNYWNFNIPLDSTEKLLYDFSLKVGDFYSPNAHNYTSNPDSLFVKKIDTIVDPDNIKRAVFIMDTKAGDLPWKGIVIEGIGGRNGLLGSILDFMDWSYQEDFFCYSNNNFSYQVNPYDSATYIGYNSYPCDTRIILSTSNNYLNKVNVHPNPASETIYFSDINNINEIMIYNNLGVLVKTETINDNKIDIKELASGIYLMYLFSDEKIYHTKFIKTE